MMTTRRKKLLWITLSLIFFFIIMISAFLLYRFFPREINYFHLRSSYNIKRINLKLNDALLDYADKYITGFENDDTGYRIVLGYPMYFYTFGKLYYFLYKYNSLKRYKNKFFRILNYIEKTKKNSWRWDFYINPNRKAGEFALYNVMFYELFKYAYQLTMEPKYKDRASSIMYELKKMVKIKNQKYRFKGMYNHNFYIFTMIADYLDFTKTKDPQLKKIALDIFGYALSGYDDKTKRWYYSEKNKIIGSYSSYSAYYQLDIVMWYIIHRESIRIIFPEIYTYMDKRITPMMKLITKYISRYATFIDRNGEDITESTGNIIFAYSIYDRYFYGNNLHIIGRAIDTLLNRKTKDSGFYKSFKKNKEDIWYSDNVAFAAQYLYMFR